MHRCHMVQWLTEDREGKNIITYIFIIFLDSREMLALLYLIFIDLREYNFKFSLSSSKEQREESSSKQRLKGKPDHVTNFSKLWNFQSPNSPNTNCELVKQIDL